MAAALFTIPIPPCGAHPGGAITATRPRPAVYLLAWASPPDNRITTAFCRALLAALDVLEFGGYAPGVVVTTSAIPKFYSNGLDLEHAVATEGFWPLYFDVWRRFLTFPMPTLALLNGHTYAGGLMLAMAHDYRLAPSPRGFLCLNELLFGAPLKPAMAALFRHKLTPASYRAVALEARRFAAPDAVRLGLADAVATGLDDALRFVDDNDLLEKPSAGVYGVIKAEMHSPLLAELRGPGLDAEERRFAEHQQHEGERKEFGRLWYEQWQRDNKAKL
ncbi:Enoyl-CoA hydratase/carnithine racemase [Tolypocladium paradoxum]|uniref:Enoyl-CoA hydratase/carnithine racemase n=1 Tax=Tolypocladium paradoxum TaxID=94208 RepID=A0A2S4KQL8_9HYPO|nr:Enoyl-CoA hydratase/carnithine racemase [Tolypocladium paradoxum]